jgi:hypothetical protein
MGTRSLGGQEEVGGRQGDALGNEECFEAVEGAGGER